MASLFRGLSQGQWTTLPRSRVILRQKQSVDDDTFTHDACLWRETGHHGIIAMHQQGVAQAGVDLCLPRLHGKAWQLLRPPACANPVPENDPPGRHPAWLGPYSSRKPLKNRHFSATDPPSGQTAPLPHPSPAPAATLVTSHATVAILTSRRPASDGQTTRRAIGYHPRHEPNSHASCRHLPPAWQ